MKLDQILKRLGNTEPELILNIEEQETLKIYIRTMEKLIDNNEKERDLLYEYSRIIREKLW